MKRVFVPKPWQPDMIEHIHRHPRCALFAGMGSGKTSAVLIGLSDRLSLMDEAPGLIIAPRRVALDTWPGEARTWSCLPGVEVVPIIGTPTERFQALAKKALWYSINYDNLPWLYEHFGKKNWPFRTIVADEFTRLKGHRGNLTHGLRGGKRTTALAKVAHLEQVERFIGLTGTPAPNGVKDLWGQMWFLDQGDRLGASHDAFKKRWFQRSFDGHSIDPLPFAQDQIQDRIRDICLTVDPKDYIDIADVIETDIVVDLPDKAMDIYRDMQRKMFVELEQDLGGHEIEAVHAAARTNKCLQIAAGSIYHDREGNFVELHHAKLEALDSIREEANGMPLFISYIFNSDLERIRKHFPQCKHIDEVDCTEDGDWNKGRVPMMAAHPASAGHGLNLQWGSNIMVDFSSGWDLEYDDQIIERIGPMRQYQAGLDRAVHRYRIMARGTVDYMVKERRKSKRTVQQILLEAMKREKTNA